MDQENHRIVLYTAQTEAVLEAIRRDGTCFSRETFIQRKYGESAPGFLAAYQWLAQAASELVSPPPGAELPYWAFHDLHSLETSGDVSVLTLSVPADEAIFFDMYDWVQILQLRYLGETEAERRTFCRDLERRGLQESDVMLTRFYPEERQRIEESWHRLFRHHHAIQAGDLAGVGNVQAALWQIKQEWITACRPAGSFPAQKKCPV